MISLLQKIQTPRLIIRPVALGDEIPLNQAINNSLVSLQEWMPWAKDPSIEAIRDSVGRGVFAWESGCIANFPMVIIHKVGQRIIGGSGYNDRSDPIKGLYEIGYWCDVDYQGQGLVTECVNALTRYALIKLGAKKVMLMMQVENVKSIGVATRLNFIHEGSKIRDPLDSVSHSAEKNHIYACNNLENLPALEVSWIDKEENNNDAALINWARETIGIPDDQVFGQSKALIKTPWSNVIEINTGKGPVYLKQTPKDLFIEAEVIKLLKHKCKVDTIPEVIATNAEHHCFIMRKCGDVSLRHYFDGKLQLDILQQGIATYLDLQKATIPHVEALIGLGVPDWRLDKFPKLYQQLISDVKFLTENGLTPQQQDQLHQHVDTVEMLCENLKHFGIDACLNHSDFHDNNMMYDRISKTTLILDLGESAVTHPFFSLAALMLDVKSRYGLEDVPEIYHVPQQACYADWLTAGVELTTVIQIVAQLLPIYLLFAQKRFLDAIDLPYSIDNPLSVKQHDKINKGFVWFIENMAANNGD